MNKISIIYISIQEWMYEMNKELKEKQQDYEETRQQNEVNVFFYTGLKNGFRCQFKTKLYVIW